MRIGFATKGEVTASLTLVNKTATRLPEAAWVTNTPVGSGAGNWSMDKLGGAVSPLEVADGASRGLHNVLSGVTLMPKAGSWYLGANVPDKPRVFMPYVAGVAIYREICEKTVADGWPGFEFSPPE